MMKINLPNGVRIGNVNDDYTGITAIVFDNGCVCGCDVRGGAPGTRETALLASDKANEHVDAVALCGGSAYGLLSACGVMRALSQLGKGVAVLDKIVPIVPAAVIYDLNDKQYHYPTEQMGFDAVTNAESMLEGGKVGAGKGATVGKILGFNHCSPSGLGVSRVEIDGVEIVAVMVVNAFGDVRKDGKIIAGAKMNENFVDTQQLICSVSPNGYGANTTIGCVITTAKLTKTQANRLATIAHNGLAKTIYPVHTDLDGDTIFCASCGERTVDFIKLQVACVKAVEQTVWDAVSL
ncbi:MAG: P1 family peptidase [Clostridia bacterium]|nr:P1 family peptidase [Clostridia bacterium]